MKEFLRFWGWNIYAAKSGNDLSKDLIPHIKKGKLLETHPDLGLLPMESVVADLVAADHLSQTAKTISYV